MCQVFLGDDRWLVYFREWLVYFGGWLVYFGGWLMQLLSDPY
jgi:hypothetical protein